VRGERLRGYGLALVSASLWATLGLIYHQLEVYGLTRLAIAFYRAAVTAVILFAFLGATRRPTLKVERGDWRLFLTLGLVGVAAFFGIYIQAIALVGMGVAAVLMYTAPAWVTLISSLFLGERLTPLKVAALLLACGGCALVGKVYDLASVRLNLLGILAGLGAGLTYGMYTILSKVAQSRYTAWASLAYAMAFGTLFLLPLQAGADLALPLRSPPAIAWLLVLGIVPTLIAGLTFNAALRLVPASEVSIVATLEPVIAAILGALFLGERVEPLQALGALLILSAVAALQWARSRPGGKPADSSKTGTGGGKPPLQ